MTRTHVITRFAPPARTPLAVAFTLAVVLGLAFGGRADAQVAIGDDDFRISHAGPDGNPLYDATHDGLAYNPAADEYLVVWDADNQIPEDGPTFNGKREVFGRVLDGEGAFVGPAFRVATAGPPGDAGWDAANPEAVYNDLDNQYFVVWVQTVASQVGAAKEEIFGRRLSSRGDPLGGAIKISTTGSITDPRRDSREPSLAFNPVAGEYLVVWQYEEATATGDENEIYAQRLRAADGVLLGPAIRVSRMGPNADPRFDALDPDVTYNEARNEYVVVWGGDDNRGTLVDNELEIFAQRLSATGAQVGPDDLRVSHLGPDGDVAFGAEDASVACAADRDECLVAWTGTDDLAEGEEVHVQRISGAGALLGPSRTISRAGPAGDPTFHVDETLVAYHPTLDEYFVVWMGEDDRGLMAPGEVEVFGQRLTADGDEVGTDDVRLSSLGDDGDSRFDAYSIDLAYDPVRDEYLVIFSGDDNRGSGVDDEVEIFGQRVAPSTRPCSDDAEAVCLAAGRFEVRVVWRTRFGTAGAGQANRLTTDTGWFWFFNPANVELVLKVLDARAIGSGFWVFFGALSNVEYAVTVTDRATGQEREYVNPEGVFASVADTGAFPPGGPASAAAAAPVGWWSTPWAASGPLEAAAAPVGVPCVPGPTALCLEGSRFKIEVEWADGFGGTGDGQAQGLTDDTGWFWFFRNTNVELIIKVLDARSVNGHFWVFYGALSNVAYTIRVTDTETGEVKTYTNPAGHLASVGDTDAFPLP